MVIGTIYSFVIFMMFLKSLSVARVAQTDSMYTTSNNLFPVSIVHMNDFHAR